VALETKKKSPNKIYAWVAPIVTFVLLAGVMAFLVWYWRGTTPSEEALTAEARAALQQSDAAPVAAQPRGPVGLSVPPLQVPGKGYVRTLQRDNTGAYWGVVSGPYLMRVFQPINSKDFQFNYMVRSSAVYAGDDGALVALVVQLSTNPLDREHSGISADTMQKLTAQFPTGFNWLPLKIADADAKSAQDLWTQYAGSNASNHTSIGTNLLEGVASAAKNSMTANQASFDAWLSQLQKLIPPDDEAKYLAGIQAAKAPPPPMPHAAATQQ